MSFRISYCHSILRVLNFAKFAISKKKHSRNIGHAKIKIAKFNTYMASINNKIEAVFFIAGIPTCLSFMFRRFVFDFIHQLSSTASLSLLELCSATKFFKISLVLS